MRHYYVEYWKSFNNTYNLFYVDTNNIEHMKALANCTDAERITRKQAERMCANENWRRKYDSSFSGFADNLITPIDYEPPYGSYHNDRNAYKNGYIIELRNFH